MLIRSLATAWLLFLSACTQSGTGPTNQTQTTTPSSAYSLQKELEGICDPAKGQTCFQ